MTDYPIIFSADMVKALLAGRKTMTRRSAWRWPKSFGDGRPIVGTEKTHGEPMPWQRVKVGNRLWVRENLKAERMTNFLTGKRETNAVVACYAADDEECVEEKGFNLAWTWKGKTLPSIYMPRAFSRLTLIVTATKIEPVQKISHDDAVAEGIGIFPHSMSAQKRFRELWKSLHGDGSWDAEVVALTFSVHKTNIDALKEAA